MIQPTYKLQVAIIADDLTGAADTGAGFARAGLVTLVALRSGCLHDADAVVISTESRHLLPEQAAAQVQLAARQVREAAWVYKKMDSTLRGHPGSELAATRQALNLERALVAPAFPAQGRTTVNGRQQVNGVLLEETSFGREVPTSDLQALFASSGPVQLIHLDVMRRGPGVVQQVLGACSASVIVADAETEADLLTIAQAAVESDIHLLCGSAGLAHAFVNVLSVTCAAHAPQVAPAPMGPVLVVAGSRHPRTACQVQVARQRGMAIVTPDPAWLAADGESVKTPTEQVASHLACGQAVILTTLGMEDCPLGGQRVASRLAQAVRALVMQRQVGRLVLTGGDVAAAACAALDATAIWLRGEIEPGVPWGVLLDGIGDGLPVITKAGGFGADETLLTAIQRELQV